MAVFNQKINRNCHQYAEWDREKIADFLNNRDPDQSRSLFEAADYIRAESVGPEIHLRSLIEFSNYCRQNCNYCGLRSKNTGISRYRMTPEEIVAACREAADCGFKTVVLQSGEDPWYSVSRLREIVREIKKQCDVAVTLSCGEFTDSDYAILKEAGADRYLLKHETANPDLYGSLHPGMSLSRRLKCLEGLHHLGFQVGTGCIVGIPGQSYSDLADDILLFKKLQPEMVGIGPFIPHPDTPLAGYPPGNVETVLRMVALTRLVLPYALIPATTALGALDSGGQESALRAGANVLMVNVTPLKYRKLYEIYPSSDRVFRKDHVLGLRSQAEEFVRSLGREVAIGYGHWNPTK